MYQERFAKAHGPLRPVVERVLRAFLTCGLVERGFARAWCGTCRLSYLIPYSCRGRSFCPSCEKKRSLTSRATTPGAFVVPPPKAEEMYSPETFGRGGTDRLVVE